MGNQKILKIGLPGLMGIPKIRHVQSVQLITFENRPTLILRHTVSAGIKSKAPKGTVNEKIKISQ